LLERGSEVTFIDDLSTGSKDNIRHLEGNKKVTFVEGTILDADLMKTLVQRCEVVYHLAAAVGVKFVIDNPVKSIETNVDGTEIVLKTASRFNRKVFLSSTSEAYGKTEDGAFTEDSDRVVGSTSIRRWSYSCSKALDEFLCLAYHIEKKLDVVIGRLFNTCGPRQTGKYGMVIPRFVRQALSGEPITVYGDGKQTRSFCHVRDSVRAIIGLQESTAAVGEVFNIGSESPITIESLARKVIDLTGSSSEIVYVPYEKAYEKGFEDMRHRVPDISKIRKFIGYEPQYDLDMILMDIIQYFRERGDYA